MEHDRRRHPSDGSGIGAVAAAVTGTIAAVIPVFLLGATAVLVRRELTFNEAALGTSVSLFFASTALSATAGGWWAERLGARKVLTIGALASATCLAGIAGIADSWGVLTAFFILGGVGNGLAQPAANLAIARGVDGSRQGFAFGIKQSAIPIASLIAGITLPVIALTVGWRWAFVGGALASFGVAVFAPRFIGTQGHPPLPPTAEEEDVPVGPLIMLAVGIAFGSAAALSLGAFLVESAVSGGIRTATAGLLLSLGGVVGIGARLFAGWSADRRSGRHLVVVAWMLLGGAIGLLLLAFADGRTSLTVLGTILGFGLAWGWPGLFFYAIVRLNPRAPATASGITQSGGALGGVLGPLAFGIVATNWTYRHAWAAAAGLDVVAAVMMLAGRAALLRRRSTGTGTPAPVETPQKSGG